MLSVFNDRYFANRSEQKQYDFMNLLESKELLACTVLFDSLVQLVCLMVLLSSTV